MRYNYIFNKIEQNIEENITKYVFTIFLIFIILYFSCNYMKFSNNFETFNNINNTNFVFLNNDDIYDDYYVEKYDKIFLNKTKNNFQIKFVNNLAKNYDNNYILDIGSGTGEHVHQIGKKYNIVGIDKSKSMINISKNKFSQSKFYNQDILDNNIFEFDSFTILTCFNYTFYFISQKNLFFDNCYKLLQDNGLLILHLVDKTKFNPIYYNNSNNILYNPNKYNNDINKYIIKTNNIEYLLEYELLNVDETISNKNDKNDKKSFNNNLLNVPYLEYKETFKHTDSDFIRKQTIFMYLLSIKHIVSLAKSKGFNLYQKVQIKNFDNEFLYIFKKV